MFLANVQTFYSRYNSKWPAELTQQLELSVNSPEHPIHHPEGTLDAHIDEVVRRGLARPEPELAFAAILHDITKSGLCPALWDGRVGVMKTIPAGSYWQNVEHPKQALAFINLPSVTEWMSHHGIDVELVKQLVGCHMTMKTFLAGIAGTPGGMGETKRENFKAKFSETSWDLMWYFSTVCDNMSISFPYH
jgi:hypothetical protein